MNTKTFQSRKKKVLALAELCMEINEFRSTQREYTGDDPTVFFEFHGHIGSIRIRTYENGWRRYQDPDKIFEINLDNRFSPEEYNKCKEYLESLLDKK